MPQSTWKAEPAYPAGNTMGQAPPGLYQPPGTKKTYITDPVLAPQPPAMQQKVGDAGARRPPLGSGEPHGRVCPGTLPERRCGRVNGACGGSGHVCLHTASYKLEIEELSCGLKGDFCGGLETPSAPKGETAMCRGAVSPRGREGGFVPLTRWHPRSSLVDPPCSIAAHGPALPSPPKIK